MIFTVVHTQIDYAKEYFYDHLQKNGVWSYPLESATCILGVFFMISLLLL